LSVVPALTKCPIAKGSKDYVSNLATAEKEQIGGTSGGNDCVTHIAGVFPTGRSDCADTISTGFNIIMRAEIWSSEGEGEVVETACLLLSSSFAQ
jgi:hypothetical protein